MEEVTGILRKAYDKKRKRSPKYSLRSMAKQIGISPSFMSQVLNGRRPLPAQLIEPLCEMLDIDRERRDFLVASVLRSRKIKTRAPLPALDGAVRSSIKADWHFVPENQFWPLREANALPILNATLLKDYDGTTAFIARRLGLAEETVRTVVQKLIEIELIEIRDGRPVQKNSHNDFHSKSPQADIRAFHQNSLNRAKDVLATRTQPEDLDKRLVISTVFTASREDIAWAKQRMMEAAREIAVRLGDGPADELYQLSMQFVPVSIEASPLTDGAGLEASFKTSF